MSVHRCPSCRCEFPPNPEALLEDELRDVIAHELEWFENPIVRIIATLARGDCSDARIASRRPGKRSMAEALRRLGIHVTRRARRRMELWQADVSAWCKDWTGERKFPRGLRA